MIGARCAGAPFRMHEPFQCSPCHANGRADVPKHPERTPGRRAIRHTANLPAGAMSLLLNVKAVGLLELVRCAPETASAIDPTGINHPRQRKICGPDFRFPTVGSRAKEN